MANYKILSDRIADKKAGDTVTDDELVGLNVDALIEAGHLSEAITKPSKADKEN